MQQALYVAAKSNLPGQVAQLLNTHPHLNPSQCLHTPPHSSPLHIACAKGNVEVLPLLLRHANVNVNKRDHRGKSAFHQACLHGQLQVVKLLLQVPGVDVNQLNDSGSSPVWEAAYYGYTDILSWIIASGKPLDLGLVVKYNYQQYSVLGIARKRHPKGGDVVRLLESYSNDPVQTTVQVRRSLKVLDSMVARAFALVVMVCDGYLVSKRPDQSYVARRALNWKNTWGDDADEEAEEKAKRFISIAAKLPMELQMLLCGVLYGSTKEFVLSAEAEKAFRALFTESQW